jgi:chemotaxis methyl-accepting protein methylase
MSQKINPCDAFLKWALPRLHLRPEGYRKVRGQVCKRLKRRIQELELDGFNDYSYRLENDPGEWKILDRMMRITISRFFRDKKAWEELGDRLLPEIIRKSTGNELPPDVSRKSAGNELPPEIIRKSTGNELPLGVIRKSTGDGPPLEISRKSAGGRPLPGNVNQAGNDKPLVRCWSAGCASGEEPYSLSILWKEKILPSFPDAALEIIATDASEEMVERARYACYTRGSLREVPEAWVHKAFYRKDKFYCLRETCREYVSFYVEDIRDTMPDGPFDLVFCKNLAAMYFSRELANDVFKRISERMNTGAYLVLGNHEEIDLQELKNIRLLDRGMNLYRRAEEVNI